MNDNNSENTPRESLESRVTSRAFQEAFDTWEDLDAQVEGWAACVEYWENLESFEAFAAWAKGKISETEAKAQEAGVKAREAYAAWIKAREFLG